MVQFYADADNGSDANDGLGIGGGNAWKTLDKFLETARDPGDILTMRRGTAHYTLGLDCVVLGDGTQDDFIIAEADYDDAWGDFVNSNQTYTPIFGSLTMEANTTITGIVAGDWIYNTTDGDDPRDFAYEVDSVSGTTLTLFLPFLGSTGSGKTFRQMGAAPSWGDGQAATQITFDFASFFLIQGLIADSDDSFACVALDEHCSGLIFKDAVFTGPDNTEDGFRLFGRGGELILIKFRIFGRLQGFLVESSSCGYRVEAYVGIIDGTNNGAGRGVRNNGYAEGWRFEEVIFKNHGNRDLHVGGVDNSMFRDMRFRNCPMLSSNIFSTSLDQRMVDIGFEDWQGVAGDSQRYGQYSHAANQTYTRSDLTFVRSGGNVFSVRMRGSDHLGPHSFITCMDIPIFTTTATKTYDVYFRGEATSEFDVSPTADELWLEIYFWGHATNRYRRTIKSTGVINMASSTAWQKLSVTATPGFAGVSYLRVFYNKFKEAGNFNIFYMDPKPVIT